MVFLKNKTPFVRSTSNGYSNTNTNTNKSSILARLRRKALRRQPSASEQTQHHDSSSAFDEQIAQLTSLTPAASEDRNDDYQRHDNAVDHNIDDHLDEQEQHGDASSTLDKQAAQLSSATTAATKDPNDDDERLDNVVDHSNDIHLDEQEQHRDAEITFDKQLTQLTSPTTAASPDRQGDDERRDNAVEQSNDDHLDRQEKHRDADSTFDKQLTQLSTVTTAASQDRKNDDERRDKAVDHSNDDHLEDEQQKHRDAGSTSDKQNIAQLTSATTAASQDDYQRRDNAVEHSHDDHQDEQEQHRDAGRTSDKHVTQLTSATNAASLDRKDVDERRDNAVDHSNDDHLNEQEQHLDAGSTSDKQIDKLSTATTAASLDRKDDDERCDTAVDHSNDDHLECRAVNDNQNENKEDEKEKKEEEVAVIEERNSSVESTLSTTLSDSNDVKKDLFSSLSRRLVGQQQQLEKLLRLLKKRPQLQLGRGEANNDAYSSSLSHRLVGQHRQLEHLLRLLKKQPLPQQEQGAREQDPAYISESEPVPVLASQQSTTTTVEMNKHNSGATREYPAMEHVAPVATGEESQSNPSEIGDATSEIMATSEENAQEDRSGAPQMLDRFQNGVNERRQKVDLPALWPPATRTNRDTNAYGSIRENHSDEGNISLTNHGPERNESYETSHEIIWSLESMLTKEIANGSSMGASRDDDNLENDSSPQDTHKQTALLFTAVDVLDCGESFEIVLKKSKSQEKMDKSSPQDNHKQTALFFTAVDVLDCGESFETVLKKSKNQEKMDSLKDLWARIKFRSKTLEQLRNKNSEKIENLKAIWAKTKNNNVTLPSTSSLEQITDDKKTNTKDNNGQQPQGSLQNHFDKQSPLEQRPLLAEKTDEKVKHANNKQELNEVLDGKTALDEKINVEIKKDAMVIASAEKEIEKLAVELSAAAEREIKEIAAELHVEFPAETRRVNKRAQKRRVFVQADDDDDEISSTVWGDAVATAAEALSCVCSQNPDEASLGSENTPPDAYLEFLEEVLSEQEEYLSALVEDKEEALWAAMTRQVSGTNISLRQRIPLIIEFLQDQQTATSNATRDKLTASQ
ncbi:hypothetical protein ACA910_013083 [Epithemia clementina (nom. ined.)]